jgi:phenylalanyl-tRNA synthetase alpha chain
MGIEEKAGRPLSDLLAAGNTVEGLYRDLQAAFDAERQALRTGDDLKRFRDRWLGRKNGLVSRANENWLKTSPREHKPLVGRLQNEARRSFEEALAGARTTLADRRAQAEALDVTLPGPSRLIGARHPIQRVQREIEEIFRGLGYSIGDGPEVESYYHNFEALNFPPDHPAVDEMDTIFVEDGRLLRTHTSPMQIRIMREHQPPLRYVVSGKVYRHDTADATHSPMFNQIEIFAVDENITFRDLKGTLEYFLREFFGAEIKTRFRPSFFPFTEPSAEVDISCMACSGLGCRVCKQTGFIELLGCGMIDPEVFRSVGYDPERYTGFAAGLGLDRLAMRRYDIDDIQLFYQGDVRFLRQFR